MPENIRGAQKVSRQGNDFFNFVTFFNEYTHYSHVPAEIFYLFILVTLVCVCDSPNYGNIMPTLVAFSKHAFTRVFSCNFQNF